jgi:hypothetical protein
MSKYRYGFQYLIVLILTLFAAQMAQAATDTALNRKIERAIAKIRAAQSAGTQAEEAARLAELTRQINPASVGDRTVADMISLLDLPNDSVRAWAAAALGNLGRRAKAAVPKLLALLAEVDCSRGDLTSAASIRPALRRIGAKPPPAPSYDDCHKAK